MTVATPEFSINEIFDPFFLESLHKQWLDDHLTFGADVIDAQHLWPADRMNSHDTIAVFPNIHGSPSAAVVPAV